MKNKFIYIILYLNLSVLNLNAENHKSKLYFEDSYSKIKLMLSKKDTIDFKKAVFLVESAYYQEQLKEHGFNDVVKFYATLCNKVINSGDIDYTERDKNIAMAQCGVFIFMTDSLSMITDEGIAKHPPFSYNHADFAGQKDWSNMFVSTVMQTKKGNCHSLPYLYKIIMDELGYESHLALAPNHIYIKVNNKKVGWYNIELTCADFPTDAWYAASGYIHTDAIRNGIYMRALTDKEAVAMTLVDLAQGYQAKFGIEDGSFIIKCCDTALEHFPKYINAMLLKAEILTELYRESKDEELFRQMTELYGNIHKLGYRKMPQQMYANWLNSLNSEEGNQQIKAILNPRTK
ncbi:hypothetical protein D0T50_06545 [Bacteroides sp. 214]|uniref:hypothetical protein n=1 Tax=Bacteroides sp. 214 TaxID=2302935 RepID=UPI0013D11809|nr:hypothetical protein [Bacteroides sp. 214]NDW12548.1 hypothetical protein [Bacteroides sp. 214]